MAIIGRKTLQSSRARTKHIDHAFMRIAQVFLVTYALFAFSVWLSLRPAFVLDQVTVEGTHAADPTAISAIAKQAFTQRYFGYVRRNNVLLYAKDEVLAKIKVLDTHIAHVTLTFDTRHRMRISITEYAPALLYCGTISGPDMTQYIDMANASSAPDTSVDTYSDCFFADRDGYVFAAAPEYSGDAFLVIIAPRKLSDLPTTTPIGHPVIDPDEFLHVRMFIDALGRMGLSVRAVEMLGAHDFRFSTAMPWDILWTSTEDPVLSAANLSAALPSLQGAQTSSVADLHAVDLRFGSKVFYK